jgi:hypothetical protein
MAATGGGAAALGPALACDGSMRSEEAVRPHPCASVNVNPNTILPATKQTAARAAMPQSLVYAVKAKRAVASFNWLRRPSPTSSI